MSQQRMYSYRAFGLNLHSELPLPELASSEMVADVIIRRGAIAQAPPTDEFYGCYRASPEEALLSFKGIGRFAVREGREIIANPANEADEGHFRVFLLGHAISVILHQRGYLVLHASVVAKDGAALAFVGAKGWGKSTMAAAMHARGYGIVTDDVAAIDAMREEEPMVYPAYAQQKLWPDSVTSLGLDPDSLGQIGPHVKKRLRPVAEYSENPLPLRRIYILDKGDVRAIEPVSPQAAFAEMVRHSCQSVARVIELTGGAALHLPPCTRLVASVPVFRLRRPPSLETISDLARWVDEDIARSA